MDLKILCCSVFLLLSACLFDAPSTAPGLKLAPGLKAEYEGGAYKLIGTLHEATDSSAIIWRTGSASIIGHKYKLNKGLVEVDTAWMEWQKLPSPKFDTTKAKDSTAKPKIDTSYIDTLSLSVEGQESQSLVVKLLNFLPHLDSVGIGGVYQFMESGMIDLPAHRGEQVRLELKFSDRFNARYSPRAEVIGASDLRTLSSSDTSIVLSWTAPTGLVEDTLQLKLSDSRGLGQRIYPLHRFTYNESGSIWLGAGNRFYKISDQGQLIYSSPAVYGEISDFAVHPTRNAVWFADALGKKVVRLNRDGAVIKSDSGFIQPSALGLDVVSNLLQVADQDASVKGRLRSYDVSGLDSSKLMGILDQGLSGPVSSINIDQYDATLSWYTVPEMDMVLKIRGTKKDTVKFRRKSDSAVISLNRPSYVAYDARSSKIWVSDSTSMILADTSGFVVARISGFEFISGVAATQGSACVLDSRQNKLYRLNTGLSGLDLQASSVATVSSGMAKPIAVDISYADASCWVVDRDAGSLLHFSKEGALLHHMSGFKLPSILRVHKGVE